MAHPYADLIDKEATRAADDLAGFRTRAMTVVTTSAGVVTVLTGLVTFAASKQSTEGGIPNTAVWLVGCALVAFVASAVLALIANAPGTVDRVPGNELIDRTSSARWYEDGGDDEFERVTSEITARYVVSVRKLSDRTATVLTWATGAQITGLLFAAIATIVTLNHL